MPKNLTVLTFAEAAQFLKLSTKTLRKHCKDRTVPFFRTGNDRIYFTQEALEDWIQKQERRNWG